MRFWSLLLLFIQSLYVLSQTTGTAVNIPPSPTSAALGTYGDVPVSLYTGTVNPKIELYSYKLREVDLNISLSYNNSGLQYLQEASNVGLGWSLVAGGVITRPRIRIDDLEHNGFSRVTGGDYLTTDTEPDIFYYNFNGYTGKFLLPKATFPYGKVINQQEDIEIFFDDNSDNFRIVTSDGIVYHFQQKEYTYVTSGTTSLNFISAWYLSSIDLLTGEKITFQYSNATRIRQAVHSASGTEIRRSGHAPPNCYREIESNIAGEKVFYENDEIILKKIKSIDLEVDFSYSPREDLKTTSVKASKLNEILVKSNANSTVRRINLNYSYFSSGNVDKTVGYRLKLDSLENQDEIYRFRYNEGGIPDKTQDLTSQTYFSYVSDSPFTSLLTTIIYPTGGYTVFEYGNNNYSRKQEMSLDIESKNLGARIEAVLNYSSNKLLVGKKVYKYVLDNGSSSGKLIPIFQDRTMARRSTSIYCNNVAYSITEDVTNFYVNSVVSLGGSGVIVGYDKVTVLEDDWGDFNGKQELYFQNNFTEYLAIGPGYPGNIDFTNGTQLVDKKYRVSNGRYQLVQMDSSVYEVRNKVVFNAAKVYGIGKSAGYTISYFRNYLVKEVVQDFFDDGYFEKATTLTYPNEMMLPRQIETINSKGKISKTIYTYPFDYTAANSLFSEMRTKQMKNYPVEILELEDGKVVKGTINRYGKFGSLIKLSEVLTLQTNIGILENAFTRSSINSSGVFRYDTRYQKNTSFTSYDGYGNLREVTSFDRNPTVYLWGYYGRYPIAKIENAKDSTVVRLLTQSVINTFNTATVTDDFIRSKMNELRKSPAMWNAKVSSYTYKALVGMTSETSSTGSTKYYTYDENGRLRRIEDHASNVLNEFSYHRRPLDLHLKVYESAARSKVFTVNNCTNPGLVGDEVTYVVPKGKYVSKISQADADQQAINDLNSNGQAYANSNGGCKVVVTAFNVGLDGVMGVLLFTDANGVTYTLGRAPNVSSIKLLPGSYTIKFGTPSAKALFDLNGESIKVVDLLPGGEVVLGSFAITGSFTIKAYTSYFLNTAQSKSFTRNNCPTGTHGSSVVYQVPAGKYYSIVSQSDANQKAINDVNVNGQNHANRVGTCGLAEPTTPTVNLTLEKVSNYSNFNPVTLQFTATGGGSSFYYTLPTTNTGSINASLAVGTYTVKLTVPFTAPFSTDVYLNGRLVGGTSGSVSAQFQITLNEGTSYILKTIVGGF